MFVKKMYITAAIVYTNISNFIHIYCLKMVDCCNRCCNYYTDRRAHPTVSSEEEESASEEEEWDRHLALHENDVDAGQGRDKDRMFEKV